MLKTIMLKTILLICLFILTGPCDASIWVSASRGSDTTGDGTQVNPFATITKGVRTVAAGGRVEIEDGTYREQVTIPVAKGGLSTTQRTTLIAAAGNNAVVITGADVVTGWTWDSGAVYYKTGWGIQVQQVYVDGTSLQQIGWPSTLLPATVGNNLNPTWFPIGVDRNDMTAGSFFYDNVTDTLYVWTSDSSDPNVRNVEVSVRPRCLIARGDYVRIKGITFQRNSSMSLGLHLAGVEAASYSIIEYCTIQQMDWCGVKLPGGAQYSYIRNCTISNNGVTGVGGSNLYKCQIKDNVISYNCTSLVNPSYESGGAKHAGLNDVIYNHNEITQNKGAAGLWFDAGGTPSQMGSRRVTIKNNFIHDNQNTGGGGIFYEISSYAIIYNNVFLSNKVRGIYISGSSNCRIFNNTIISTKNRAAICVANRNTDPANDNIVQNNLIYNNEDIDLYIANNSYAQNNSCHSNLIKRSTGSLLFVYDDGSSPKPHYYSVLEWQNNTPFGLNSLEESPNFQAGSAGDHWPLTATSPARNSGVDLSAFFLDDYINNPRNDGLYDIGAYEYQ